MGRPKGGKNRKYTVEEKLEAVRMKTEEFMSSKEITKRTGIHDSLVRKWVSLFSIKGIEGLKPKERRGNPYAALHTSKSLNKEERLELENLKLKIENERLKKGYLVKGGGVNKEYVTTCTVNTKS